MEVKYGMINGWDSNEVRGPYGTGLWKDIMQSMYVFGEGLMSLEKV